MIAKEILIFLKGSFSEYDLKEFIKYFNEYGINIKIERYKISEKILKINFRIPTKIFIRLLSKGVFQS